MEILDNVLEILTLITKYLKLYLAIRQHRWHHITYWFYLVALLL